MPHSTAATARKSAHSVSGNRSQQPRQPLTATAATARKSAHSTAATARKSAHSTAATARKSAHSVSGNRSQQPRQPLANPWQAEKRFLACFSWSWSWSAISGSLIFFRSEVKEEYQSHSLQWGVINPLLHSVRNSVRMAKIKKKNEGTVN